MSSRFSRSTRMSRKPALASKCSNRFGSASVQERWRIFRCSGRKWLTASARIPHIGVRSSVEWTHRCATPSAEDASELSQSGSRVWKELQAELTYDDIETAVPEW